MGRIILPPTFNAGFARGPGESAYPRLWDGLVGAWVPQLGHQGITTLRDMSGYSNHGTLNGSMDNADWVASERGYALDFDGTNDYIRLIDSALYKPGKFSLNVWFCYTGSLPTPAAGHLLSMHWNDAVISIVNSATGVLGGQIYNGYNIVSSSPTVIGRWDLATLTFDGTTATLYRNGVNVGTDSTGTLTWEGGVHPPAVGSSDTGSTLFFAGKIDAVFIHARALLPSEIMSLYLGASPLALRRRVVFFPADEGSTQVDIAGSFTMSLAFSGDLAALGEMTGTTNFTLTFSGAMAGLGFLSSTTTFSLAFSGDLTGQGFVASTFPITLTFDGSLGSNELNGGFTITLTFTGDMVQPVPPPEPVVDPCERYQCDADIESVGNAIVSAGYKLATQPAEEAPDRAAPRIANNSVRLTPTVITCRRVRKG